ncbi:MAG: HAMP domain-containing histidine kinase [Deltaproteobacteria bacterium]|nr:HAMP domain-containing histidine kinase [Deltaproteobacteria bacterium]
MRLAAKLTVSILAAIVLVFGVRGYQAARRQMLAAEERARENSLLVGRALRPALTGIWRQEGPALALEMLAYAADRVRRTQQLDLRFVRLPSTDKPGQEPLVNSKKLAGLAGDEERHFVETVAGSETLLTYLPVAVAGQPIGALEISGPLTERDRQFREEIMQTLTRTALAALAAFLAVAVAGYLFVGRPMRRLVAKARRIGAGDLTGPLDLHQNDEVGVLAKEINQMCERLAAAQARVEEETNQRLAASEQLRHADRLTTVGKLASGVAHELGTPLNVVSGRAKMILRGQVSGAELVESAQSIVDQTERMTGIIRQLLGFARRRKPEHRREGLRGVVERTISLLRPMAEKSGITCTIVREDPEPFADIDVSLIEQALTNLVVNAVQAMPGGGTLTIRSCEEVVSPPAGVAATAGSYACLHVEDTGVGMTSEQLRHAFEPFFTTKDVGSGTGLGLSVAHGIVRDHGGWLAAASAPEKGSRFSMYLPASQPTEATDDQNPADRG